MSMDQETEQREEATRLLKKHKDDEGLRYPTGTINCGALAEHVAKLMGIRIDDRHWLRQLAVDVAYK